MSAFQRPSAGPKKLNAKHINSLLNPRFDVLAHICPSAKLPLLSFSLCRDFAVYLLQGTGTMALSSNAFCATVRAPAALGWARTIAHRATRSRDCSEILSFPPPAAARARRGTLIMARQNTASPARQVAANAPMRHIALSVQMAFTSAHMPVSPATTPARGAGAREVMIA